MLAIRSEPAATDIGSAPIGLDAQGEPGVAPGSSETMRAQILNHARQWIHDQNRQAGESIPYWVRLQVPFVEPMREAFLLEAAQEKDPSQAVLWTETWRFRKWGWLRTINISGRVYVTAESLNEFVRRAEEGDFAKVPAISRRRRGPVRP